MKNNKIPTEKHDRIQYHINSLIPQEALGTRKIYMDKNLPELRLLYTVNVLHRTTMQTRIVNESNGKKIDYYPYYRKVNDFQYKSWKQLANDGEILTVIKTLLR
jgi:hypothetical protein